MNRHSGNNDLNMQFRFRHFVWLLCLVTLAPCTMLPCVAMAQPDSGDEEFDELDEKKPAATGPREPTALDVAVQTIVDSKPTEPAELARATVNLLRLDRADLAAEYFQALLDMELETDALAELGAEVGTQVLSKIISSHDIGPQAEKFGRAVQQAWRESLQDPARLEALAEKTLDADPQQRYLAIVELRKGSLWGVAPLLKILADADRRDVHPLAREALVHFGPPAAAPLIAVLETSDPLLKQNVIRVLAQIKKAHTERYLLADAWTHPDKTTRQTAQKALQMLEVRILPLHEARPELLNTSRAYIDGSQRVAVNPDGSSDTWIWNDQEQQLGMLREHPAVSSARASARLARDLVRLAPDDPEAQRWRETTALQVIKLESGLDGSLDEKYLSAMPADNEMSKAARLNAVLDESLRTSSAAAAIAASELIAHLARADKIDEDLLVRGDGRPAPLALALHHSNRRVQLAAAAAIVALDRKDGFPGAGALMNVLKPVANYSGIRRAVVADPRGIRADQLAALLTEQGLEAQAFQTGKGLYQGAVATNENELALITYTIGKPDARRLIEHLRNDARTAHMPIGLIADPDQIGDAEALARNYPMVQAFIRPRDSEAMQLRIEQLLAGSGLAYITPEVRTQQARLALELINQITQHPAPYDLHDIEPILNNALFHPQLSPLASEVLGHIHSHEAQTVLVDFASLNSLPLASRQAAVKGLQDSLARHGILLTYDEIKKQVTRYDESEGLEQATQDVLWSILDALQTIKKKRPVEPPALRGRQ